jgi:hypothetical protein
MKTYQIVLMLILTLLVGVLFVRGVPRDENAQIATLSAIVTRQQQTIQFLQQQPTLPPTTTPPPVTVTATLVSVPSGLSVPTPLVTFPPFPSETGGRIVNVQTALEVTTEGCVTSPQSSFAPTDTIYGVVLLADVAVDDQLNVRFTYETGSQLIYEDTFVIREPGSFCRWYTVEPDSLGWEAGDYTVSYQLNDAQPVSASYSITREEPATPPPEVTEEAMMEEGQ